MCKSLLTTNSHALPASAARLKGCGVVHSHVRGAIGGGRDEAFCEGRGVGLV